MTTPASIIIDGTEYAPVTDMRPPATAYKVIRTENAGAWGGYVESIDGSTVTLTNARRFWYWKGAASLSELALKGPGKPNECKFPAPVDVVLLGAIEIIQATEAARVAIEGVPTWTAQ